MLKYIKLVTINNSITILRIEICNNKPPQSSVLSVFMQVQDVYKRRSDSIWSANIWSRYAVRNVLCVVPNALAHHTALICF